MVHYKLYISTRDVADTKVIIDSRRVQDWFLKLKNVVVVLLTMQCNTNLEPFSHARESWTRRFFLDGRDAHRHAQQRRRYWPIVMCRGGHKGSALALQSWGPWETCINVLPKNKAFKILLPQKCASIVSSKWFSQEAIIIWTQDRSQGGRSALPS